MRTTGRPPAARKTPQAAASPTKPVTHIHPQLQQHAFVNPASIQALAFMQSPPGWAGMDNTRIGYAPGTFSQFPPGVVVPPLGYPAMPPPMTAQQFQAQQALVLQAQLAQLGYAQPPPFPQLAHPSMDPNPDLPQRDPFVYVQAEVSEAVDAELMETIRKRALFVAPPARLRIPQACERCRKRKTKCTGEKPQCKRCKKRGIECEYVWEHRANRTKKAVAEREQAIREGSEAVGYKRAQPLVVGSVPVPPRPPVAHASSSSGYSAATSASSLPPPLMLAGDPGQLYLIPSMTARGASSEHRMKWGVSALPTPTIMVDGCPISAAPAPLKASSAGRRAPSGTRSNKPTPSNSTHDLQAVSRSTSTMSLQYPDLPAPWPTPSTSCQGCISEMSNCAACAVEHDIMHGAPRQHTDGMHVCQSDPKLDSLMHGPLPPSPPPAVKQHLFDALNKVLAQQAAERAACSASPDDHGLNAMSAVPPLASRGGSSSSSGTDQSGAQTPYDYFNLPSSGGMSSGNTMISPAMLNLNMGSPEYTMAENAYRTTCGPPDASAYECMREEQSAGMQFSDYLHAFGEPEGSTSGTM
ncbi:hypothetical protein BC628DRAFT_1387358 [Trametes gibbosa]|nr:hypothetical protein BC628DRAFT_1387358 [Trametes gibbosa]UVI59159.1 Zn(2)-Cys(6)61 [Trametes gibbosa]